MNVTVFYIFLIAHCASQSLSYAEICLFVVEVRKKNTKILQVKENETKKNNQK